MSDPKTPFQTEPFTDFTDDANADAFRKALAEVESQFGAEAPLYIGGEWVEGDAGRIESRDPAQHDRVVGTAHAASVEQAEQALDTAWKAFDDWKRTPAEKRAELLCNAADLMRERKHLISAWMVYEVGKAWNEADADTAEAIDFLDFYGRQAIEWDKPMGLTEFPGETNECWYIPLGAGVAIPPWNFACAIMTGTTTGPVAAGNTIVCKPSSDSPMTAWQVIKILEEVGFPAGVVNYLPGGGSSAGEALIQNPRTRFVNFTGSREVGLHIVEVSGQTKPGQKWIKRVVAEMGGKDAILVDETADLDAAAAGVVTSAYGFQGQKCSACSRLIVHEDVHDELLEKVVAGAREINQGHTSQGPDVNLSAVINKAAFDSINEYIGIGREEGELVLGGESDGSEGWFIRPTIFDGIDSRDRLGQEEIFGPVLAVITCKDWDDGIRIANDTDYGLTGAVYTAKDERIADARERFHVGNLYANRKCTGALVDVQPFGGFNMSGTDGKAGGRDYLANFLQAKSFAIRH